MIFINKTKNAVSNLASLYKSGKLPSTRLTQMYENLKQYNLIKAFIWVYKKKEKNIEKIIRWDSRFHDVLLSASRNPRLVKVNAVLIEQVHRFRKSYIEDITTAKYIVHSHKKILDALKSRDPEISRTCAMEHIREVKEFILDKYKKKAR